MPKNTSCGVQALLVVSVCFYVNLKLKKQCLKTLLNLQANRFIMDIMFQFPFRWMQICSLHERIVEAFREQCIYDVDHSMVISK